MWATGDEESGMVRDYALDFNYEAPFYSAFAANHVELTDAYDKPVIDWLPLAQSLATARGFTGAFYEYTSGRRPRQRRPQ